MRHHRLGTALLVGCVAALLLGTLTSCGPDSNRNESALSGAPVSSGLDSMNQRSMDLERDRTSTGAVGESTHTTPADGGPEGWSDAASIADQLARDMEALRNLSDRPRPPAPQTPAETIEDPSAMATSHTASRPPRIMFNEPMTVSNADQTPPRPPAPSDSSGDPNDDRAPAGIADGSSHEMGASDTESRPEPTPIDVRLRETMVALASLLAQDAAYQDSPLPQYLAIASMAMVDPSRQVNPDAFPDLTEREREILTAYQAFFVKIGRSMQETGDAEALLAAIDGLRETLEPEPMLRISAAELCVRVDGIGKYETFSRNAFLAGTPQPVIVYTEVEDFTSVQNSRGEWVTDLSQELIIYGKADNLPAWRQPWMSAPDSSMRRRSDFFISHIITLPERLSVGSYTLKVRVRDEATGTIAESGVDFQIVADPNLAARIP